MGWFAKSKKGSSKDNVKEELWTVCPGCKAHVYKEEWAGTNNVCPKCNFHDKLTFQERLDLLLDKGSFREVSEHVTTSDPLNFVDAKGSYSEKAKATKSKTGMNESIVTGTGAIGGHKVVIAVMDFRFLGGSLASGTGERILLAAEHALKNKLPYIIVSASGGARMHEGIISLMQMAKTCAGIARLRKASMRSDMLPIPSDAS